MKIIEMLKILYPDNHQLVYRKIEKLIESKKLDFAKKSVTENDVMLITYGDSIKKDGEKPLQTLHHFLKKYAKNQITNVHLLPMFPYSSDDGFSVIDYEKINPELGDWNDIKSLSKDHGLMFDAVINHISKSSKWFQGYLNGDELYKNYFIECDPKLDYSDVVRPRALPLYYPFQTYNGLKYIWATFSDDQVDLNYENPEVLLNMLDILINYAIKGARFIRFDAVGFMWKKIGTTSIHLNETHFLVQIMRYVIDKTVPGTMIVSETNVPHKENIIYFGDGTNEAHMVYQFPLPPLTLFSLISGSASKLKLWAMSLQNTKLTSTTTYFNFLASHDGIGMRPVEDILNHEEKQMIVDHVILNGGKISYKNNKDGSTTAYELNINYQDAVSKVGDDQKMRISKFMASQVILLSMVGVPGIYIHSLLGSRNDYDGLETSGINRRINREKLDFDFLIKELKDTNSTRHIIFNKYLDLIDIRRKHIAFSPFAKQEVIDFDDRIFSILRYKEKLDQKILVLVNVSQDIVNIKQEHTGYDIINNEKIYQDIVIQPYGYRWVLLNQKEG
jgi:glucosylglycerate phosphorylase